MSRKKTETLGFMSDDAEDQAEFISLISPEEEEEMHTADIPSEIPILPLRNTVLFPGVVAPITVGRDKSIALIKKAHKENKIIGVLAQKSADVEDPTAQDLNQVGTIAQILKMLKMPDGNITAIIQGKRRFTLNNIVSEEPFFTANVNPINEPDFDKGNEQTDVIFRTLKDLSKQIINASPNIPSEAI
ncbi:MAG: LON peptidase substrate-binding domain-containing protein, partial [Bacteroidia bacterium]